MYDFVIVVDELIVSGVNVLELCGFYDGIVLVLVYDWVSFFVIYFKKFLNIKNFYYFRFIKEELGVMYFR